MTQDQRGHWSGVYASDPVFFGPEPSEFGRAALERFRSAGVRDLLELGCGQGRDTLLFGEAGLSVTAADYSHAAVEAVTAGAGERGLGGVSARVLDFREPLPFPDGSFDACFSHMLLCMELTEDEVAFVLHEVRRVLRPGGLHLYSVRSSFHKHYGAGRPLGEDLYEVGGFVVHFFDEAKIRRLSHGYELVELSRLQEGSLPRDLFAVTLRRSEDAARSEPADRREERPMLHAFQKFQEFFDATYGGGVLDRKTKHLVALGASLAAACDS
jgi:SAM-dependent methyltransferase